MSAASELLFDVPALETSADAPTVDEVRELVGHIPMLCEVSVVHPCTERDPQPAQYLIVWAPCNCDPFGEDYEGTCLNCEGCFENFAEFLQEEDRVKCPDCDFLYKPSHTMIERVVLL